MFTELKRLHYKRLLQRFDWKLLLFLIFFLNVKLAIKIPAIVFISLFQFNFKFGFRLANSRLPVFYPLVILIALAGYLFTRNYYDHNYQLVFLSGIGFWLLCLLAVHQVKLSVENNSPEVIHNTVLLFFLLNTIVSCYTLGNIMWETGSVNPYRYQGEYQKYFIGTGDYIKGLTFDVCTTNAILNAFGVVYFLDRKNWPMVLVCMAVLLLTGSNFINLVLLLVLGILFVFKTTRDQKSAISICVMFLVVFMAKVSPQNNQYTFETFKNIIHPQRVVMPSAQSASAVNINQISVDSARRIYATRYLDSEKALFLKAAKAKIPPQPVQLPHTDQGRIFVAKADINTPPYQTPTDTTAEQRTLLAFIAAHKNQLPVSRKNEYRAGLPGKALALVQTINFLNRHPIKWVTGDGVGNFSSKLAFKATSLGFLGNYPVKYAYINPDFLSNHLDLYLNYYSKKAELHTLTNSPYSAYDQLLAEYGLSGLVVFVVFYLGYFARHYNVLTYGIPLLLLMMAAFFVDYWFEQLSVVVFFELLMLLNIKETANLLNPKNHAVN